MQTQVMRVRVESFDQIVAMWAVSVLLTLHVSRHDFRPTSSTTRYCRASTKNAVVSSLRNHITPFGDWTHCPSVQSFPPTGQTED